jgi:NagD protein
MKSGYLIDMDGVIYRENQLIPGSADFVQALVSTGVPFLFLTNNSAPTPEDLAVRLNHLGIAGLSSRHFYTSALNTADFLTETHPNCTALVLGGAYLLSGYMHVVYDGEHGAHPGTLLKSPPRWTGSQKNPARKNAMSFP